MFSHVKDRFRSLRGPLVRAAIFAVAWGVCPYWLFLLIALYLFLVPISQARNLAAPFIVLLGLAALIPTGFPMAIVFGVLFWYILLIKELYLVDRRTAYEVLVLGLTFLVFRLFYERVGDGFASAGGMLWAAITAAAVAVLFAGFTANFADPAVSRRAGSVGDAAPVSPETAGGGGGGSGAVADAEPGAARSSRERRHARLLHRVTGFAVFFATLEITLAGLFLPLDFVYQSTIAFVAAALLMDFAGRRLLYGAIDRTRVLVVGSAAFALLAVILGSARWGL